MSTFQVIKRLLGEAKPLAGLMVAASTAGTIGHLAATFLPVFGIIAGFALAGNPVWGMRCGRCNHRHDCLRGVARPDALR